MFFMEDHKWGNKYTYDKSKIQMAHYWCQEQTENAMKKGIETIIVSNTFTKIWMMERYYWLAATHNYNVQEIICKGNFQNIHGCPQSSIDRMKKEFEYVYV